MENITGILGSICIAIAWIPQIVEIIKTKHSHLNLGFASLYAIGSLALTVYSIQIKDIIFTFLNSFALLMGIIGLIYTIKSRKNKQKINQFLKKL
jgi:lipid-A-disaccharide synthase-like uncharacterized protein